MFPFIWTEVDTVDDVLDTGPRRDEGWFETILDSLDEGVVTLGEDGRVLGLNRAASEILEVDQAEALGRACPFLLGDESCTAGSEIRRSIAERRPVRDLEVRIRTARGKERVLNVRTSLLRDPRDGGRGGRREGGGGLVVLRDVTEIARLRRDLRERYRLDRIIGKSKAMREVFELVEQVADTDASVLIEGETGTGKELVARAIHQLGARAGGPFVAVNCSALPASLLESELFGHVRGAFTGAVRHKRGRFEAAGGGTIFLDEIGDVPGAIQVKLLRVLQERVIERVGDEKTVPVDLRVISATNRSLGGMVVRGEFRSDLYYRLRVVPVRLPALRERRDDIPLLVRHFVDRFRESTGRPIEGVDPEAMGLLLDYPWPGNVRELENVIEYAFVKARHGGIRRSHLPPELLAPQTPALRPQAPPGGSRPRPPRGAPADRARVEEALAAAGWNIAKAARRLGISRTTLYKRIAAYGLREGADGGARGAGGARPVTPSGEPPRG